MKHLKAQEVFPKYLLDEIQQYVHGELIYIPKSPEKYKKWGANTGIRKAIQQRNEIITREFNTGISISQLADSYSLSEDTIKKIVYRKR